MQAIRYLLGLLQVFTNCTLEFVRGTDIEGIPFEPVLSKQEKRNRIRNASLKTTRTNPQHATTPTATTNDQESDDSDSGDSLRTLAALRNSGPLPASKKTKVFQREEKYDNQFPPLITPSAVKPAPKSSPPFSTVKVQQPVNKVPKPSTQQPKNKKPDAKKTVPTQVEISKVQENPEFAVSKKTVVLPDPLDIAEPESVKITFGSFTEAEAPTSEVTFDNIQKEPKIQFGSLNPVDWNPPVAEKQSVLLRTSGASGDMSTNLDDGLLPVLAVPGATKGNTLNTPILTEEDNAAAVQLLVDQILEEFMHDSASKIATDAMAPRTSAQDTVIEKWIPVLHAIREIDERLTRDNAETAIRFPQVISDPIVGVEVDTPVGQLMLVHLRRNDGMIARFDAVNVDAIPSQDAPSYEILFTDLNHDYLLQTQYILLKLLEPYKISQKAVYLASHSVDEWTLRARHLVLESIAGPTLNELLSSNQIAKSNAVQYIKESFSIIKTIHEMGIVHNQIGLHAFAVGGEQPLVLTGFSYAGIYAVPHIKYLQTGAWDKELDLSRLDDLIEWIHMSAQLLNPHGRFSDTTSRSKLQSKHNYFGHKGLLQMIEIQTYLRSLKLMDHPDYDWIWRKLNEIEL